MIWYLILLERVGFLDCHCAYHVIYNNPEAVQNGVLLPGSSLSGASKTD